jgi:hypothetical protein
VVSVHLSIKYETEAFSILFRKLIGCSTSETPYAIRLLVCEKRVEEFFLARYEILLE